MRSILIVDDETLLRQTVARRLRRSLASTKVRTAGGLKDASRKIKNESFDIVVLDMRLGETSGIQLIADIRSSSPETKIIAHTAFPHEYARLAVKEQIDAFLVKPAPTSELVQEIQDQLLLLDRERAERVPEGTIFCLMPFAARFDDVYLLGIRAAAESLNLECRRIDEKVFTTEIVREIQSDIMTADFIVADLTSNNPNVYYEVGFAHGATDKPVILLAEQAKDLCFDLSGISAIIYEGKIHKLKEELEKVLVRLIADS